jgi:hypothetical protein
MIKSRCLGQATFDRFQTWVALELNQICFRGYEISIAEEPLYESSVVILEILRFRHSQLSCMENSMILTASIGGL